MVHFTPISDIPNHPETWKCRLSGNTASTQGPYRLVESLKMGCVPNLQDWTGIGNHLKPDHTSNHLDFSTVVHVLLIYGFLGIHQASAFIN